MRNRTLATLSVIATLLATLSTGKAVAQNTFTFHGSGWGHGIGMSQYGAYGLALDGWTYKEILTHFYTGVTVGPSGVAPASIRVGLLQGAAKVDLSAEAAKVELHVGGVNGTLVGSIPAGFTWTVEVSGKRYEVLNAKGERVGGKLWGGRLRHLYARYEPNGARVTVAQTGHTYNRGWIEFNLYGGASKDVLRLIAEASPQPYLYGIAEVPSSWPAQVLQAQAVAARTYAFRRVNLLGQHREGCNCAVYASTSDQVYVGWDKEGGSFGEQWVAAVNATAKQVIRHKGQLILAVYHSTSGGYTENVENVWGGEALPYLRGVCDPGDWNGANPYKTWSLELSGGAAGTKIEAYTGKDIGFVTDFTGISRGVSGRVISITAEGSKGEVKLSGVELRGTRGLRESRVWINQNRNITGAIRTKYDQLNCAPGIPTTPVAHVPGGLRQRYADGGLYRNTGQAKTWWVRGPIFEKYVNMEESKGKLGMARSGLLSLTGTEGRKALFEDGSIFYSAGTGAHALHGPVLDYFLAHGGAGGSLGLPTTDVTVNQNGAETATFQGGTVTCPQQGACKQS
jgi:SpoIID/LytB domain protein